MRKLLFVLAAALVFAIPAGTSARADSGSASFTYLIGSGFLCGLDPSACPAIARADNGDTIEITGSGTLSIHPKSVTGGGTFTHKNAAGMVLGGGTWTATQLLSFKSYGTSPEFPPTFEGGLALIGVHLTPDFGGLGFDATLQVDCDVGSPPAGAIEGVRLAIHETLNFNKEVSGLTLYIQL